MNGFRPLAVRAARAAISALVIIALATAPLSAVAAETLVAAPASGAQGILYRAEKDGNTLYLLGSIHVGTPAMAPFAERIERALSECEAYVFECDLEDASETAALTALMFSLSGALLRDAVSAETYALCQQVGERLGLSLAYVKTIKPWALYAAFSSFAYQAQIDGATSAELEEYGVDARVLAEGKARGRTLLYLETALEQYRTLDAMSPALQEYLLAETARAILAPDDVQGFDATLSDWPAWWAAGDADAFRNAYLTETQVDESALDAEYTRLLVTERNARMASRLDDLVRTRDEKTFLVTVGLLHLVLPDDSVPARLREMGYQVEEMPAPADEQATAARHE